MLQELLKYWEDTAKGARRFHPCDASVIEQHQHSLPVGRIPEPWFGVPSQAKVFYLTFNPGHKPNDKGAKEPWRSFCRDMMLEGSITYDRYCRDAPLGAMEWFRRNHGGFCDVTFPHICNLRLIAYPSPEKADLRKIGKDPTMLPSSRLMMKFVHEELVPKARADKVLLLVMRSPTSWGFEKRGSDYWDGGIFVSRPLRQSSISLGSRVGSRISEMLADYL